MLGLITKNDKDILNIEEQEGIVFLDVKNEMVCNVGKKEKCIKFGCFGAR